jgi:hypothetical protein
MIYRITLSSTTKPKTMKKKFYRLTWGGGMAQICSGKSETVAILFDLLEQGQSVKVVQIEKTS